MNRKPYWLPGGRDKVRTARGHFTVLVKQLVELRREQDAIWRKLRLELDELCLLGLYSERIEDLNQAKEEFLRAHENFMSLCATTHKKLQTAAIGTVSPSPS